AVYDGRNPLFRQGWPSRTPATGAALRRLIAVTALNGPNRPLSEAQAGPDSVSARRPHLADEPRGGEGNVREGHGNVNRIEGVSPPSSDDRPPDATAGRKIRERIRGLSTRVGIVVLIRAGHADLAAAVHVRRPVRDRVLCADARREVRRVREALVPDGNTARLAAALEPGAGVAEGAEQVERGCRPGGDLELDALAPGSRDVRDVVL